MRIGAAADQPVMRGNIPSIKAYLLRCERRIIGFQAIYADVINVQGIKPSTIIHGGASVAPARMRNDGDATIGMRGGNSLRQRRGHCLMTSLANQPRARL